MRKNAELLFFEGFAKSALVENHAKSMEFQTSEEDIYVVGRTRTYCSPHNSRHVSVAAKAKDPIVAGGYADSVLDALLF